MINMEMPIVIIKIFVGRRTMSFSNCKLIKGDMALFWIEMNMGNKAVDKVNNAMVCSKLLLLLFSLPDTNSGNNVSATRNDDSITINVIVPLTSMPPFSVFRASLSEMM